MNPPSHPHNIISHTGSYSLSNPFFSFHRKEWSPRRLRHWHLRSPECLCCLLGLWAFMPLPPPPDHVLSLRVNKDKEQDVGGSEDL